jgi:PAS domain S-box-containing protein
LGYAVNLKVSKPLVDLSRIARTIAMGDLDYPIPSDRYDEIGDLGRSFDKMRKSIRDKIENLKEAQVGLVKSNERFRAVMDSVDALVYVSDILTYDILFINEFGREESGDVVGKKCWEVMHPNQTGPCSFCSNENFLADSDTPSKSYTWEKCNEDTGEWFEYRDRAIQWIDGDRVKLTIRTNITDRKKAVVAIKESEEKFRMISEQSRMGLVIIHENRFKFVNQAFSDMLGYSIEELLSLTDSGFLELVHKEDRNFVKTEADTRQDGKAGASNYNCRIQRKNGEVRWISIFGKPVTYLGGKASLAAVFDITDETLYKIEREKLMRFIESKNEELESIVQVASHDLRTPLVNIQGFAYEIATASDELFEFVQGRIDKSEMAVFEKFYQEVVVAKDYISNNVSKQAELLSSLLKVSRLGRRKVAKMPLDVNKMVKSILDTMAYQIQQNTVSIKFDELSNCFGDEVILTQVFTNLIENAIKYKGDNPCEIQISGVDRNGFAEYCVEDNGVGISKNIIDNVFDLFYRYDQKKSEGEGIGLSIVKRGVIMNGGKVWVESEPGIGSKFFVSMPTKDTT